MDFFKFIPNETDHSFLEQGEYINGIKTATWIERYRPPGEFEITAPVNTNMRTFLPPGTIISHIDTHEAMMVETISLDEDVNDKEPVFVVKGRSLEAWLNERNVGQDVDEFGGAVVFLSDYTMAFDTSWNQIADLINLHINLGPGGAPLLNAEDAALGFTAVSNEQHTAGGDAQIRIVKRGPLHTRVLELLQIDDFGIKVVRPNPANANPLVTEFRIHNGNDLSADVIFSHVAGDIQRARYLWSNRGYKNAAYVVSTYNERRYRVPIAGYNQRTMFLDASFIDSQWTDWPTGTDRDDILTAMQIFAIDAVSASSQTSYLEAVEIAKTSSYKFREHYDVGDLVTVNGNYDVESVMRVTEHVEFQDENGQTGYPTLSAVNE
jgi:hypothetical protein